MSTGDWKSSQALEAAQPKGLLDEEQRKNLQAEWDKLMVPGPKDTWQPPQRAKDIQKALETDQKVREIPAKLVNSALAAKDSPVFAQREDEVGPAQQYDWQNADDPRRQQLEKEAVDYAQQDPNIFRYDPRKRQSMIDQGGWDNAKEASYQSSIIGHAQEVVAGKQILLQRGIESGAIDPQQAEQMKADIQSRTNYVKAGWEAVQKLDPKTIQEKLNEQNQQVADIQHSMGLTGAGTATAQKIGEGAVSGVGNTMIKPLLMAYSKVFGDDSTYSTADRAIDAIAEVTSEMDSHVASHYKKQLFEKNEDGTTDFNPHSIVPQLAGGITELVPFLALSKAGAAAGASEGALFGNAALGASIGSKAAIFGTTYADTYDRYIRDTMAKDKNITEAEAKEGANIAATGTALLFAVNPNLDMAATQKKVGAKVFSQMADGVTKKDIVANLLKEIGKGGTTQVGLNFGVLAADNVANDAVNQLAGTNLPTEQTAHELLSSTAGAFLIGGALALGHGGSVSDMRAKAMRSAMEHPEAAKQVVKESSIPSEQKSQAYENIDNARRDYVGNNLKRTGITDAKATQFVDNEAQIRQIKEHIKENPPSDVVKEAKSDPRDAQLEKLYKEQRDILGIPEPEVKPSEAKKEPVALPKAKEEQPTEKKSDVKASEPEGGTAKADQRINAAPGNVSDAGGLRGVYDSGEKNVSQAPTSEAPTTGVPPTTGEGKKRYAAIDAALEVGPNAPKPDEPKAAAPYQTKNKKFTVTHDPDTGEATVKAAKPLKDTWTRLPDGLKTIEKRRALNTQAKAQARAILEYEQETGTKVAPRVNKLRDLKRTNDSILKDAGNSPVESLGPMGLALRWLGSENKINSESSIPDPASSNTAKHLGWTAARKEGRKSTQEKAASWALDDKEGVSLEKAAHGIWENLPEGDDGSKPFDTGEIRDALATALNTYTNKTAAIKALEDYTYVGDEIADMEAKWMEAQKEDYEPEADEVVREFEGFTPEEQQSIFEEYDRTQGQIDSRNEEAQRVDRPTGSQDVNVRSQEAQSGEGSGGDGQVHEDAGASQDAKSSKGELVQSQRGEAPQVPLTGVAHIDSVTKALSNLVPNLKVEVRNDSKTYKADVNGRGDVNSSAFYDEDAETIYINLPRAKDNTLFHEAAHPVLRAVIANNPDVLEDLYNQLKDHPDFQKYKEFGDLYPDKSAAEQKEESLVEHMGDAVVQYLKDLESGKARTSALPKSLYQKLKQWIKDMLAKLGFGPKDIKLDPTNLRKFAEDFAKAMTEGIKVRGERVKQGERTSLQHDADRLVDGWYSRLDDAVVNKGNTQSGADWGKWMDARAKDGSLSAEEVKWTGLGDWLAGKGKEKVTPKEVRDFLKDNRVKVEVKEIGSPKIIGRNMRGEPIEEYTPHGTATKFSQYQLPGGKNYREVLVTLPATGMTESEYSSLKDEVLRKYRSGEISKDERNAQEGALIERYHGTRKDNFHSSHFAKPNILVHLRVNDRTDADGKKVLFVEEMQSDWGQKGKKEGFGTPPKHRNFATFASEEYGLSASEANELWDDHSIAPAVWSAWEVDREAQKSGGTPSAPFVTDTNSWVELGLKQAIRMAVEGGYDRIAWTHGQVHTDRWGTERIEWAKQKDGSFLVNAKSQHGGNAAGVDLEGEANARNLNPQNSESVSSREELEVAIRPSLTEGQDAKKLSEKLWARMEAESSGVSMPRKEGFEGFYDKILPSVAKKVSKKLGGDGVVGEVGIDTDKKRWEISPPSTTTSGKWMVKNALDPTSKGLHFDTEAEARIALKGKVRSTSQQSITITPEMKAKVGMGVPLMQLNPEKVAAAMRAEGFDAKAAKDYLEGENITKEDKKAILLAMERAGSKAERSDLKKQVREAVKEAKANLKLADKRANQGYRQGMAEGQLGGEIEGKKAGRKEGALEQRKLNRELADRVEGILDPLRSEVSPGQAKALVKAANKVQSDIQLENFQRVADKIIDDAEYGDRLDEADNIRSGIKKKLKSKEASKRNTLEQMGLFKEFSQLDPSKVADLADYTSIAERVKRNLDAIQVRNGEIQNADLAISNDELSGYLAGEISAQREQAKKDLIVQYEQMVKDGLLSGDLTLDQMKDIINASEDDLEAALEKSGADDKLTTLRDFAEAKLGAMSTGIFTANTPAEAEVLKNIMQIDPQRLPAKDLVRLNNVLNNIQVNSDYSGSGFMSSVGKEHQNATDLVKAISGVRVQEASGDLDRLRTEAARIDAMTLDNRVASEARRLMGSDAYGDASHRVHAIGEHNLHDAEQEMKRLGLKAKDDTKPNRNLMFVYSWVIQNEGGTPAQQQAFFQNQKAMIAQSIERLMDKSASSENKERGAIMKEAFKIAEDAKTPEEVRSNLEAINPALAKFVDWGVNKGKEVQERSFENKKINDNEVPTVVNNWTHAKQRSLMPTSVDDLGKNTFVGRNLDRSGSRSMISRVNSLGQGRVLDGDFISNLLEGWHQNNYANETQSDRMLMERMLNNTDVIQALGQHNVELLRQQAKRKTEGDKSAAQPMSKAEKKAVRAAHRVIRMGSGIALKSLTQLVKQPVVLTNVSTVLGKDIDLLFHPMDDVAGAMAGRMIEGRGEYMAGIEPTGRTITKGEAPLSNTPWQAVERGLTKVADASDKLYRPLTGADVWSAKQTWKAFYLKSLRDRGMWKKGDSVVNDEQAAAYANHMTEKLQGSNSITTMAQVYQAKGVAGLLRYMYMPFTSFSAQTRSRMVNDIQKIRLGTSDQKKEGAQGLGATVIEQATYNAAKVAIYAATLAAAKMAIQGLFGYDDDKDKDGNDIERDNHTVSKFFQGLAEDVMAPGWPQILKIAAEMIINDIATTIHPATTNKDGKRVPYEGPAYVYDPSKYGQSDLSQLGAAASAVQMGQKLWDNRDYWDGMIYETTRGGDSPYSPTEVERLTRLGLPTTSNPDRQGPTREETLRLTPKERAAMVAVNVSRMGALLGFSETQINTMMNELEKETKRNIGKRAKLNAFQKYSYPKSLVNDMVEVQAANYNAATDKAAAMKEADKAFREKMSPAQYKKAMKMYSTARANPDMPFFYIRLANKAGVDDRAQALFDKYESVPKEEHKEVIRNATIAGVLTDDVREKFKKLMLESKAEDAVNRTKAKE